MRPRTRAASGRTSKVPRGAWYLGPATVPRPYLRQAPTGCLLRQLGEERVRRLLRAQAGVPHVPGVDRGLGRMRVEQGADRAQQGGAVATGQVDATDRSLKEDVAGEDRPLAANRVGDVARAVAGGEDDVEGQAGKLQRLAALHGLVGLIAL